MGNYLIFGYSLSPTYINRIRFFGKSVIKIKKESKWIREIRKLRLILGTVLRLKGL